MSNQTSWNGDPVSEINVEIDVHVIANALVKNQAFIDAVTKAVRNQMLKDVRTMKTLFGKWGGTTK